MLFCETGSGKPDAFDDLSVFVNQLNALGVMARISDEMVPDTANRNQQFDVAGLIAEDGLEQRLVLVGAQELVDETLVRLRRRAAGASVACLAIGAFKSEQHLIGVRTKLSYVLGQDPEILNLADQDPTGTLRAPVFGVSRKPVLPALYVPTVCLIAPDLDDQTEVRSIMSLATSRRLKVVILTDAKSKNTWISRGSNAIPVYHFGEILPHCLAQRIDIAVFFGKPSKDGRGRSLVANLAAGGAALIDGTMARLHAKENDAFIEGPLSVHACISWLSIEIAPNLDDIRRAVLTSRFVAETRPEAVLSRCGYIAVPASSALVQTSVPKVSTEKSASKKPIAKPAKNPVYFVPTNGVGLGHAQRCSLIAAAFNKTDSKPVFAAFPSCIKMLKSYGFDTMPMVSRSSHHSQEHEHDLINYLRLKSLTKAGGTLVFDGGYVFDSIYRSIMTNGLKSVWIRRGLWQPDQDNSIALDREKIFDRVIVPSEAFDELNEVYSSGSHIHKVGPIVQRMNMTVTDRAEIRLRIAALYGRDFKRLCVTMLGGGVAADRKAQTAAICGMMDRRRDTLNLIVTWPTATVEAGTFAWENTRVVKTHHASALVAAADLYISAVGYNSFHEVIYNQVPTIFMPQMSAFMDDQRTRARSAVTRGLAAIVEDSQMMTLAREITLFLDQGKSEEVRSKLAALALPDPGNVTAARLIKELQ